MTEDWGDTTGSAKKGGIPGWLMFCGAGCLLLVLAAGVVGFLGFRWVKDGTDPSKGVQVISETIQLDQVPEGYKFEFGQRMPFVGVEFYIFRQDPQAAAAAGQSGGLTATVFFLPRKAEDARFNLKGEEGTILVQGLEFDCSRHQAVAGESYSADAEASDSEMQFNDNGAVLGIDLTPALGGRKGGVYLQRPGNVEPVTDDEARAFLAGFHIGPDRGAPTSSGSDAPMGDEDPPQPDGEGSDPAGDGGEDR